MKLTHDSREIEDNVINYGDGQVMIRYKDTGDLKVIPRAEIEMETE